MAPTARVLTRLRTEATLRIFIHRTGLPDRAARGGLLLDNLLAVNDVDATAQLVYALTIKVVYTVVVGTISGGDAGSGNTGGHTVDENTQAGGLGRIEHDGTEAGYRTVLAGHGELVVIGRSAEHQLGVVGCANGHGGEATLRV